MRADPSAMKPGGPLKDAAPLYAEDGAVGMQVI
jgi:hypothetical protein